MNDDQKPLLAHQDKLLQAMEWAAQSESLQRRHRQEMATLLSGMLEVLDGLQTMRQHLDALAATAATPLPVRSVEVLARQMLQRLAAVGVEPMNAAGQPLDLAIHEVVGTRAVEAEDDHGRVLEEASAGFLWHRRLLRRAKVIIGQAEASTK